MEETVGGGVVYMAEEEKAGGQPWNSHSGLFDYDSL